MSARGSLHQRHRRACPRDAEGNFVEHKCRGTWYWTLDVHDLGSGKRRRATKGGFRTRSEAHASFEQAKRDGVQGRAGSAFVTLDDFMVEWLKAKETRKPATYEGYRQHVDNHISPSLGSRRLDQLRASHIQEFVSELQVKTYRGKPLASGTIRNIITTLHGILELAQRRRLVTTNEAEFVDLPEVVRRRGSAWNAQEVAEFLDRVSDCREYPMWHLALHTGMRRGELVGLQWSSVDLVVGSLLIVDNDVQVGSVVHRGGSLKPEGHSERIITIDRETCNVLERWRREQLAEAVRLGRPVPSYVFTNEAVEATIPHQVSRAWVKAVAESGQRKIRLHDARHTHATLGIEATDLKVMSERLGHSTIKITADLYQHSDLAADRGAADAIAAKVHIHRAPSPGARDTA